MGVVINDKLEEMTNMHETIKGLLESLHTQKRVKLQFLNLM